jgi:hypothetical protein
LIETKECTRCHEEKNLDEGFYVDPRYRGGYKHVCKLCMSGYESQSATNLAVRMAASRLRNRQYLWDYYLTHPCEDCGEDDPVVLELDHIRGEKVAGVSQLVHNTRSIATIQREIDKCEVVCANCHRRRTATSQDWYAGIQKETVG